MSRINQALHQMKLQDWALKIKDQASSGLLVSGDVGDVGDVGDRHQRGIPSVNLEHLKV